jgi:hypothetical protein
MQDETHPDGRLRMEKVRGVTTGRWRGDGRSTNTVYPVKYMVALGDLRSGFSFYGPFRTVADADGWADANLRSGNAYRVYNMFDVRSD